MTTYNRPEALALVLQALAIQTQQNFEVIIADDGSTAITAKLIEYIRPYITYPLRHVWQEDKGFRAARARNRCIAVADGHYLIFLDGDCIPQVDFIAKHCQLAEVGWFIAGNRILLSEEFTTRLIRQSPLASLFQGTSSLSFSQLELTDLENIFKTKREEIGSRSTVRWLLSYLRRDINRILPLLRLPCKAAFRKRYSQKWQGAKTCNLGLWREDILTINGFDEDFQGWGHEDAELVVRLLRSGIHRKEGRFAVPVLHLWHSMQDRAQEQENRQRLDSALRSSTTVAQRGIIHMQEDDSLSNYLIK